MFMFSPETQVMLAKRHHQDLVDEVARHPSKRSAPGTTFRRFDAGLWLLRSRLKALRPAAQRHRAGFSAPVRRSTTIRPPMADAR